MLYTMEAELKDNEFRVNGTREEETNSDGLKQTKGGSVCFHLRLTCLIVHCVQRMSSCI